MNAFRLGGLPRFDLIIADEAHRCAGPVTSDFGKVLRDNGIPAHKRLFMTATPRYFTGRVLRESVESEFEVASMDDEATFGPVFHRLGFAEAIDRELLTDYQVVIVGVDDATYRDWAEQGLFVTVDGTTVTDARTLAGQIGMAKAMRRYNLRRMISFHSRVKRAKDFAQSLPTVIDWMPAEVIESAEVLEEQMNGPPDACGPTSHPARCPQESVVRHARGLLSNARCLTEGVDVPTLDGVAFIDPRHSEVDIFQGVGRAIRRAVDKTVGTIVILDRLVRRFIPAAAIPRLQDDPDAGLVIVPDGPLWSVPWQAAPTLQRTTVTLAPSLTVYSTLAPPRRVMHVVALIDDTVEGADCVLDQLYAARASGHLTVNFAPAAIGSECDLLLIVAHGAGSGLRFETVLFGGALNAYDIARRARCHQAIVAACWSAKSPMAALPLNLQTSLLIQGCSHCLGGAWPLPQRDTTHFIADVISRLAQGSSLQESIANARASQSHNLFESWGLVSTGRITSDQRGGEPSWPAQ